TACAAKKAARTLREKIASKSSTFTSGRWAGRFMPALLTRTWNGSALAIVERMASTSVTSSVSASALSPRARIAAAAASISGLVRGGGAARRGPRGRGARGAGVRRGAGGRPRGGPGAHAAGGGGGGGFG